MSEGGSFASSPSLTVASENSESGTVDKGGQVYHRLATCDGVAALKISEFSLQSSFHCLERECMASVEAAALYQSSYPRGTCHTLGAVSELSSLSFQCG